MADGPRGEGKLHGAPRVDGPGEASWTLSDGPEGWVTVTFHTADRLGLAAGFDGPGGLTLASVPATALTAPAEILLRAPPGPARLVVRWTGARAPEAVGLRPAGPLALPLALTGRGITALARDPARTLRRAGPVLRGLLSGTLGFLPQAPAASEDFAYREWLAVVDTRRPAPPPSGTPVTVLTPIYRPDLAELDAMLASVAAQTHGAWVHILIDDGNAETALTAHLKAATAADPRRRLVTLPANTGISGALNAGLDATAPGWVCVLDQDDRLHPHALGALAAAADANPSARLLYTDEDKIDAAGRRSEPNLKPAWNRELLLGQNTLNHLTAFRRDEALAKVGFDPAFDGAQDWDLYLRLTEGLGRDAVVHIARPLYHWRAGAGSTAASMLEKPKAAEAGRRAVQAALDREGQGGRAEALPGAPYVRVVRPVPEPAPEVAILIPTRDRPDLLRRAVGSVMAATGYPAFTITILDNGSTTPAGLEALDDLSRDARVRVLSCPYPFNYARLNHDGVAATTAPVLCLLNDDVEVLSRDWLAAMVTEALRPDVGPVGAKLLYPDDTIQHAGIVLGPGGVAGHEYRGLPADAPGPFHQLHLLREVSAVTAACLVVRRAVWDAVGGLDAEAFPVAWNDVDFCLRCADAGYRTLWQPAAVLRHWESQTRGPDGSDPARAAERAAFIARWGDRLRADPFRNPAFDPLRETRAFVR